MFIETQKNKTVTEQYIRNAVMSELIDSSKKIPSFDECKKTMDETIKLIVENKDTVIIGREIFKAI